MRFHRSILSIALGTSIATTATALDYPIGITNCGVQSWIPNSPQRAVTMNQGTTEVMLALGLEDRMAGTAYLDDYIWPELEEAYNKVPVIAENYPTIEQLEAVNPDFVYASYGSAFRNSRVNYTSMIAADECTLVVPISDKNESHCRKELNDHGIQTYLQKPYCELQEHRPTLTDVDMIYDEVWDIASIFDVYDNGRKLVDSIEGHFRDAARVAGEMDGDVEPISVLWLDGWDTEEPFVGACCGSVQTIIEKAGAKNIFDDLGIEESKSWENAGWDEIAERDPDLIVLVDASWDLAHQKIYELCSNEATRELRAVQNRAFIQVPFSASTFGVRIGSLSYNLAEAFAALIRGEALPTLQFTETSIADDGTSSSLQALSKSGARVFEQLPTWNGTNLDDFCPGSNINLQIRDDIPLKTIEEAEEEIQKLASQVEQAKSDAESDAMKKEELQADAQAKAEKVEELENEVERLTNMVAEPSMLSAATGGPVCIKSLAAIAAGVGLMAAV